MPSTLLSIESAGLVTSVGLSAPASCAAFRAKVANPTPTRYKGADGEWIMGHQVPLPQPWRGLSRLAKMAARAIEETLQQVPRAEWGRMPMLLCVAEAARPGRTAGLDDELFLAIQRELGLNFAAHSMVITQGRAGVAVALAQARVLIENEKNACSRVLIAATDSLLSWPTLSHHVEQGRLLSQTNSNGFMPGEGAGALLVSAARGASGGLLLAGVGFGVEAAHIDSEAPLRADGLAQAIKGALADAGQEMAQVDFRVADLSGEHHYFKEAALALSRTLRTLKEECDVWHPAECMGEAGAVIGVAMVAQVMAACKKRYAKGSNILAHMSNDGGQRAAMVLRYQEA